MSDNKTFTLEAKQCQSSLTKLKAITSADHANLEVTKSGIVLSAQGNNNQIRLVVNGEYGVAKGIKFGFNVHTLESILKGRSDVQFTLKDNQVDFYSKVGARKYTGHFLIVPFEAIKIEKEEGDHVTALTLSPESLSALSQLSQIVAISNRPSVEPMTLFVKIDKDEMSASCYNQLHIAFARDTKIRSKQAAAFALPLPTFDQIKQLAGEDRYELCLGQSYLTVHSEFLDCRMPLLQGSEGLSYDQVSSFVQKLPKTESSAKIPLDDLKRAVDNFGSVRDDKSSIDFVGTKGTLQVGMATKFGAVAEQLKNSAEGKWKKTYSVPPDYFQDILNVFPGKDCVLEFSSNMVVLRDLQNGVEATYSCLLL